MINAGALDTRIRLIPPGAAGSDAWGNPAEPTQVPVDRWANVRWVSGKELVASGREFGQRAATIRTRSGGALSGLNEGWQVQIISGPAKGVLCEIGGVIPLAPGLIEIHATAQVNQNAG